MTADGSSIWRRADEDDGGGLPHVRSVPAAGMIGERHGAWTVLALATPARRGARATSAAATAALRAPWRGTHSAIGGTRRDRVAPARGS